MEFPMPTEDSVNRSMLEAWRSRGELLLQHCKHCRTVIYYPRKRCTSCLSEMLENRPSAGKGTVVSFSVVHRGVDEAFRQLGTTVTLAVVRTDDGPQLITRIVGNDQDQVQIGHRVQLFDGDSREGYPLPVYCLVHESR
jgi:uncharacterized OB-fold protein